MPSTSPCRATRCSRRPSSPATSSPASSTPAPSSARPASTASAREAELVHEAVQARKPGASTLLDVACGTGAHLAEFRRWYRCEGVDLEPKLLAVARERLPDVPLGEAEMRDLDLGRRFDA